MIPMCSVSGVAGFVDVSKNSWYRPAVMYANDNGYMRGISQSYFAPGQIIDRATMATVIYRMSGSQKQYKKSFFTDCKTGAWYFNAVQFCAEHKIVKGYGNGKYKPDDFLRRQDMAVMLYRFARFQKKEGEACSAIQPYLDWEKVSRYAENGVSWAITNGIISGISSQKIAPLCHADRAALAQVLMNYDERICNRDVHLYRVSDSNPYGLAIQGNRLNGNIFECTLCGASKQSPFTMQVTYKLGEVECAKEVRKIGKNTKCYHYVSGKLQLEMSGMVNVGKKVPLYIQVDIYQKSRCVFTKKLQCNEFFQKDPNGRKLFYKKDKVKMDCRILLWHEFISKPPEAAYYGSISTPKRFEENIQYLLHNNYAVIPLIALQEYQEGTRALPQKSVVITLDDGYLSNYTEIYPILKKYQLPATIFATVSTMDKSATKMRWDQMAEMEQSGLISIQSHSWKHEDHSMFSSQKAEQYFKDSFALLEEKLGKRSVRMLAYPYGLYSERCITAAKKYNVKLQLTTNYSALDLNRMNLSCLPRITVNYNSDMKTLCAIAAEK